MSAPGFRGQSIGTIPSTSRPTSIFSSATAHIKGAWVELIAATAFDADYCHVDTVTANAKGAYLLDIGIGAAASEVVLIPDFIIDCGDGGTNHQRTTYPLSIPAGSRLSGRLQGSVGNKNHLVAMEVYAQSARPALGRVEAVGVISSGDTSHTKITPSATAHIKGAWVEMVAASTFDSKEAILFFGRGNIARSNMSYFVDIAIGAAASEVVIIENIRVESVSSSPDTIYPQYIGHFPFEIPAGTRIAARCQAAAASQNLIGCAMHLIG